MHSYTGQVNGTIVWPPKGENGFGYDPFFIPKNSKNSFGEMKKEEKMKIDHRYDAFKKILKNHLWNYKPKIEHSKLGSTLPLLNLFI